MKSDAVLLAQRAEWVGQHALALFFGLLVLVLAATCAGWWSLRRSSGPRRHGAGVSTSFPGLRFALGVAISLAGAAVFGMLAHQLSAGDVLARTDLVLTDALRVHVPLAALQVFALLTHLADTATLTVLCIVIGMALVVLSHRWLALGWVVAVAGNGLLNSTLKQIFGRARPLHPDELALAHGFSFPSGHSSGAVVAYGMLAYVALRLLPPRWHLPTLLAAELIILTVGVSRLFLRVHFASDVMAGLASGAAWLALCVMGMELLRRTAKG
jgi:undecaprenyl-diphosphatase